MMIPSFTKLVIVVSFAICFLFPSSEAALLSVSAIGLFALELFINRNRTNHYSDLYAKIANVKAESYSNKDFEELEDQISDLREKVQSLQLKGFGR